MHYYLSSENSYPLGNPYQSPMNTRRPPMNYYAQGIQDPSYTYFNPIPIKSTAMLPEETYAYNLPSQAQPHSGDFSAYNFGGMGQPSSYSPTMKNKTWSNTLSYNYQAQQNSLDSLTEFPTFEPFKEQFAEPRKASIIDEYFNQEFLAPTLKTKDYISTSQTELAFEEKNTNNQEAFMQSSQTYQTEKVSSPISTNPSMKGWSEDDEKLLRKLAVQYRMDWKKIAKKFDNKKYTPYFLKMRYKGIDEGPVPKRIRFSHEEDVLIAKYFDEYGVEWEKMVVHFTNRTSVMIKNRYYSYIKKNNLLEGLLKEGGKVKVGDLVEDKIELNSREETDCGTATSDENELLNKSPFEGENKEMEGDANDEVAKLKAQVKSLKSLYFVTLKKLNKAMTSEEN